MGRNVQDLHCQVPGQVTCRQRVFSGTSAHAIAARQLRKGAVVGERCAGKVRPRREDLGQGRLPAREEKLGTHLVPDPMGACSFLLHPLPLVPCLSDERDTAVGLAPDEPRPRRVRIEPLERHSSEDGHLDTYQLHSLTTTQTHQTCSTRHELQHASRSAKSTTGSSGLASGVWKAYQWHGGR